MLPVLLALLSYCLAAPPARIVEPSEAAALVDRGATVLDTRGPLDFLAGHIPGAVRVDWRIGVTGGPLSGTLGDGAADAFAALGVDARRPVLVVGAWAEGWGEEGRIAWDLAYLGHPDVAVLHGEWPGATTVLPSRPVRGAFTARPRPELRATRDDLAGTLVDTRDPDEFAGARRHGEARGGHIPGAINAPWRELLKNDPKLAREARIVTYCTGGVRSAMAWLWLIHLGYPRVANYDGSWWEYAREN